jgi:GTP-binding protein
MSGIPFIDRLKIFVESGSGGDGCVSFRREKFIPYGGPNGGDGGQGGDVFLTASHHLNTFFSLSKHPHIRAENGEHGMGSNCTGASGDDIIIGVPQGTVIYELTGPNLQERRLVAELLKDGDRLLAAKGGRRGRGNTHFKSSTNRAPRKREMGTPGEKKTMLLELKLLADVGLVGLPNAGKSTMLARLTRARPKIAAYPFTTLSPVLGACAWKNRDFVLADLPGLIENAHQGRGLGFEFLRHAERTRVLIHLVDPGGFGNLDPLSGIRTVERELALRDKTLLKKPRILAVTKSDLGGEALKLAKKLSRRRKLPVVAVSAHSGENLKALLDAVVSKL